MIIIWFFVLLLTTLLFLAFVKPLNILFVLDSEKMDIHITIDWLRQLKIRADLIQFQPHISISIFNKQFVSKFIKQKRKTKSNNILKALDFKDTSIKIFYGLNKPHLAGLFFAAISFIASWIKIVNFEQFPDFFAADEYLKVEATSKLNVGKTVSNIILLKMRII